jgi:hypothetical protein
MMRKMLLPFCLVLSACAAASRPVPHAPPEEAAQFKFPRFQLPEEGLKHLDGNMAAAIQLAMDDFLPWDARPPREATPGDACMFQRESYDVTAAPASEGVVWVRFILNDDTCPPDPASYMRPDTGVPLIEMTTYAVDVRTMRILTVGTHLRPRKKDE